MKGSLRDEAVRKGQAQDAGDTGCDAEEKYIPVKTGRLAQREFATLGDEGRN